jgi:hypothetical protein
MNALFLPPCSGQPFDTLDKTSMSDRCQCVYVLGGWILFNVDIFAYQASNNPDLDLENISQNSRSLRLQWSENSLKFLVFSLDGNALRWVFSHGDAWFPSSSICHVTSEILLTSWNTGSLDWILILTTWASCRVFLWCISIPSASLFLRWFVSFVWWTGYIYCPSNSVFVSCLLNQIFDQRRRCLVAGAFEVYNGPDLGYRNSSFSCAIFDLEP